jgi:hypothetical protein
MRQILTLAAIALLPGMAAAGHAAVRYGVVSADTGAVACLTMAGPRLAGGTPILVVFDNPQTVYEAVVGASKDSACAANSLVEGTSYSIDLGRSHDFDLGIAVLTPRPKIVRKGHQVFLETPGVRTPLTFATCAAGEGIHLTAWRGSRRVWHQYYYLGYDVEPDCSEKEYGSLHESRR